MPSHLLTWVSLWSCIERQQATPVQRLGIVLVSA